MKKIINLEQIKVSINKESDVNSKLIIPYLNKRKIKYERIESSKLSLGIPDFLIYWKKKFIFVEIKYNGNVLSPRQRSFFAKYPKDSYLIIYKNKKIYLYDSKEALKLIIKGEI